MDAIEKAIRNAFEKGDPNQRAFREKVYRSAFAALERALQANPNVTEESAARRRDGLSATISQIETEYLPAVPAVEAADTDASDMGAAFEPVIAPDDREPVHYGGDGDDEAVAPPSDPGERRERRQGWLRPVVGVAVLALLALGAWWLLGGGPATGDRPAPPQTAEDGGTDTADTPAEPPRVVGTGGLDDWISVFDPADPTTVTAPGDSRAEVTEEDGERFMRISSGRSGSPVLFDVGQGVLEQVAGRRAVFGIVAQAQEGSETQISVDCSLAELGDCGRKRYAVGVTREEFLFEMDLPAVDPGAGGTIAINPDIENGGRAVDIFAIRVSPAE